LLKIGIVIGSTRSTRKGADIARWILDHARSRLDADYEILDVVAFDLAFLDQYPTVRPAESRWIAALNAFDGYVFVSPEYNHAPGAALKNAMDLGSSAWHDKAAAFVGYGGFGGVRAVEILRLVAASLQLATVKQQVALTLSSDFSADGQLIPRAHQAEAVAAMFDGLVEWSSAMRTIRAQSGRAAA
jgi:NAD(P)H-dependent FMN reductase